MSTKNIAIFASGSGSNAEKIMEFFQHKPEIQVTVIFTNNPDAGVIKRAEKYKVPVEVLSSEQIKNGQLLGHLVSSYGVKYVVLAGYMKLIPSEFISQFRNRILNIHPALLPKYGGKGMYGMNVHRAVIKNKEPESGITIHLVNEKYDEGPILFQAQCSIDEGDSPELLAEKIHALEHEHFPQVISDFIREN
jgi:phosphoribosylglycinamide formyltransferase-1